MVEDIAGGLFKFIGRLLSGIFIELILELLIKGAGRLICKPFTKIDPKSDGVLVTVVGLLFWIILFASLLIVFR